MCKCIAVLHIRKITKSSWLFNALSATNHTKNMSAALMTLFGDFVSNIFLSTQSLASSHNQFLDAIWQSIMSSAKGGGAGCLTCQWDIISLQSWPVARKNMPFKSPMPSNSLTQSCLLSQTTGLQTLSTSFTISTAVKGNWPSGMAPQSTTIQKQRLLLTTLSAELESSSLFLLTLIVN
jgi:hypothetical protein